MKYSIPFGVLLTLSSTIHSSVASTTCDSSVAIPFPDSSSSDDCSASPACAAVAKSGADSATCLADGSCPGSRKRDHEISKRSYTCTGATDCYFYKNVFLCVDWSTGDYNDITGGSGNVISGAYTPGPGMHSSGATSSGNSSAAATTSSSSVSYSSMPSSMSMSNSTTTATSMSGTATRSTTATAAQAGTATMSSTAVATQTGAATKLGMSLSQPGMTVLSLAGLTYLLSYL